MREESAKMERQKLAYERELAEQKAILEQQRGEARRRREEIKLQAEEQRKAEREHRAWKRQMAQLEYDDRDHDRDVELGLTRLRNADRNDERKYELACAKLDRATELAGLYDGLMDSAQRRYFYRTAFNDARMANHLRNAKIEKEQRGIIRERELYEILKEFNLGDPLMMDLAEPNISMPMRRFAPASNRSYLHSFVFTGVERIVHSQKTGQIFVIFTSKETL